MAQLATILKTIDGFAIMTDTTVSGDPLSGPDIRVPFDNGVTLLHNNIILGSALLDEFCQAQPIRTNDVLFFANTFLQFIKQKYSTQSGNKPDSGFLLLAIIMECP